MMSRFFKLWKACALLGMLMVSGQLLTNVGVDDALRIGVFAAIGLFAFLGLGYGLLGPRAKGTAEVRTSAPLRKPHASSRRRSSRRWSRTASSPRITA